MSIKRSESQFASSWLNIQTEFTKMKDNKDDIVIEEGNLNNEAKNITKKGKDKNKKGKNEKFSDKIAAADIKDWKEHKLDTVGFFESLKDLFATPQEARYTFQEAYDRPSNIPESRKLNILEEGDIEFNTMDPKEKLAIDIYANQMMEQYLKNGLSSKEAARRKEEYGPNKLPDKKKKSELLKLLAEMTTPFSNLLWICGILSMVVYFLGKQASNYVLAIVIFVIITVTGFFSYYQNGKSDAVMESIKAFSSAKCEVVRESTSDGKREQKINVLDLVPGDVIEVKSGQKIPADIRVVKYSNLKADCSSLTGESIPITMSDKCGEAGKADPLKSKNILFFSTLCKDGICKGVVIKTGPNTFMGKIADLTSSAEGEATSLQREINIFVLVIAAIAIFLGILFFAIGMIIGQGAVASISNAIGILTANIPEGLIASMTVLLALTAYRMFKHKVMVKNLQSVETLGSITCICSDKTGTLTQNKMTVVHLWYDKQIKKTKASQEDIRIDNDIIKMELFRKDDESFKIYQFAGVCGSGSSFLQDVPDDFEPFVVKINAFKDKNKNASEKELEEEVLRIKASVQGEYMKFYKENIDERISNGDASETGILKFFEKQEPIEIIRAEYPIHSIELEGGRKKEISIPFNSENKFAAYLRRNEKDGSFLLAMKGAPERIIQRCNRYIYNGREVSFKEDPDFQNQFKNANKCFALKGERVIGLAYCRLDKNRFPPNFNFDIVIEEGKPMETNLPVNDLCFVGLIAMEDPPRPGVKEAIALCKKAGIKVIMVTGDQTLTAASIAYQIGIIENLDDTPEIIKENKKLATIEEAEKFSQAIIIAGDRLYKYYKEDEVLSDDNPNKGVYLMKWVMKRDVVFARTSPEQKLIIVSACQSLNHVVAVTGDGVNDSPAIKKSDIGIAMGKVGTDVAKEAADIILLDDNFANIVKGIKRGRVIFDNLKKICAYNITSNVAELYPFLIMTFASFPQPLTAILCLCLDVFANIYPDVAFAYEVGEANIMTRKPRNSKTDRLCPLTIFGYAYFFIGLFEFCGAMLNFFIILNDFGIPPMEVVGLSNKFAVGPTDMTSYDYPFNPEDRFYQGNTFAFSTQRYDLLGLNKQQQSYLVSGNVRIKYVSADIQDGYRTDLRVSFYYDSRNKQFSKCKYPGLAYQSTESNCYTNDIVVMAQGSYLFGVITLQLIIGCLYRTISESIYVHPLRNWNLNAAYFIELGLICLLVYTPGLNKALGYRPLSIRHWCPTVTFTFIIFYFDEFRKLLVRRVKRPDGSPGWFSDWFFF